jgi:hypothetical protein
MYVPQLLAWRYFGDPGRESGAIFSKCRGVDEDCFMGAGDERVYGWRVEKIVTVLVVHGYLVGMIDVHGEMGVGTNAVLIDERCEGLGSCNLDSRETHHGGNEEDTVIKSFCNKSVLQCCVTYLPTRIEMTGASESSADRYHFCYSPFD